ncbi:hypothetical protein R6Q57_002426 [Mikania cordata]
MLLTFVVLQTDKASVLSETVRRIKDLKNMVSYLSSSPCEDDDWCFNTHRSFFIPSEKDLATVGYYDSGEKTTVRAVVCCNDRPDLNHDLMKAINSVCAKAVKAEMATVGGRTQVDVVVEWPECGGGMEDVGLLRTALNAVVKDHILGRRFVNGANVYDENENGHDDGLIMKSL